MPKKIYSITLAEVLNLFKEAEILKMNIHQQFFDTEDGWFYDAANDGSDFIKSEGSEGQTALWANAATPKKTESVKIKMMNPEKFYVKAPFQTMSANYPKFDPLNGYWRGPNWFGQACFGIKGFRNYGFNEEAGKATIQILNGAEGLMSKGKSIRENYRPTTDEGLNAENFSWSAVHIIMILTEK